MPLSVAGHRATYKQHAGPRAPADDRIKRSTFSPDQLAVLEETFNANPLPNLALRSALAEDLGLTPRCVQVWFQNRRQKVKKLQQSCGGSTSNDTDSAADSVSMPRNSSTGSFDELLNAEFERLNHSPLSEKLSESTPPSRHRTLLPRAAERMDHGGREGGISLWAQCAPQNLEPMPLNFSGSIQSLLGARMDEYGRGSSSSPHHPIAAGDEKPLPELSEYRRQLMLHLAAVDPSLDLATPPFVAAGAANDSLPSNRLLGEEQVFAQARLASCAHSRDAQGEGDHSQHGFGDTLDAAASLLFFSATAALLHRQQESTQLDSPLA